MNTEPNESGDAAHPMGGPLKWRIQELGELAEYVIKKLQPVLDFVQAIQEHGFVLEVMGYPVLKLKVGKPEGIRIR